MTPIQQQESAERLARPLIRLAQTAGIATSYIDQLGTYVEIRDEVLVSVLHSLGINATNDEAITDALDGITQERNTRLLPPTIVKFQGTDTSIPVNTDAAEVQISITLEGEEQPASIKLEPHVVNDQLVLSIPEDLPIGYHTLTAQDGERTAHATLILAPARIELPEALQERQRWGWMAQMYSVRSPESWGVGDYGDLRQLISDAATKSGADFMLINPIHATAPISPLEPSPYLPESRRFLNVTYIRPQDIEEYQLLDAESLAKIEALHNSVAAMNDDPNPMDINAAWDAKRKALFMLFQQPRSASRQLAFEAFKEQAGPDLDSFATWCTAFEVWGAPWEAGSWFTTMDRTSPQLETLRQDHAELFEFQRWLQWIADEQVSEVQSAAKTSGMALGLMQDMAVGVHALGADVWWSPERFADGVTVGAPPDFYNQQGQDWGQPPFDPNYLERTGYAVYRDMVHNMFSHAGAVRIDHVLGLFRLWWIPQGEVAQGGAYVTYNVDAMLAVLSIEATRANGVVIGEDLGTVPTYVSKVLASHGILGTVVEWFSRVDNSPNAGDPYADPSTYRKYALASVTTHDLPPTAGYLNFEHVKLREELHLLTDSVEAFQQSAEAERQAMLDLLVQGGWLDAAAAQDVPENEQSIVEAMHAMLLKSPSVLLQAALVDGAGEHRTQNQPGTSDQYPNWRIPLADAQGNVIHTQDVFSQERVLSLSAVMRGER